MMHFSITELYMYKSYCPTTLQRRWSSLKCTALVSLFWSCALKIVDQSPPEKGRKRLNTFLLIRRQRNKNCIPFFRLSALSVNGGAPKTLFLHKIWESECFQAYQIDLDGWDNDYLFRSTNLMGTILLLFFICRVWVIFLPRGGRVVHHICVIIGSGSGLAIFCESVSYKWPLWEKKKTRNQSFLPTGYEVWTLMIFSTSTWSWWLPSNHHAHCNHWLGTILRNKHHRTASQNKSHLREVTRSTNH